MEDNKDAAKQETQAPAIDKEPCTLVVTPADGSEASSKKLRFHVPTLLEAVKNAPEGKVKLTVNDPGEKEPRLLFEGDRDECVEKLKESIIPVKSLQTELAKFVQFLTDHSNLRAIGFHAICVDDEGRDCGFGACMTAANCTKAQAVSLVNCGDANLNEFVVKAKLEIPGRAGAQPTIVTPTAEEIRKLG